MGRRIRPATARSILTGVVGLLAVSPDSGWAQGEPAALVLRIPASPRAAALGTAYAGSRGSDVVFATPAAIALSTGIFASAARYGSASTFGSAAASTAIGRVGIAIGAQWLDYDTGPDGFPAPVGALTVPGPTSASSLAATLAASFRVAGFRVGAGAKYVEERAGAERGSAPGFDLGLQRDLGRYTVGVSVQNVGPALDLGAASADLPTRVAVGASSPRFPLGTWFDVAVLASAGWERGLGGMAGAGIEALYIPLEGWTLAARAAARRVETDLPDHPVPVAFGAGVGLDRVSIDYAFEPWRGRGAMHYLGFRIQ